MLGTSRAAAGEITLDKRQAVVLVRPDNDRPMPGEPGSVVIAVEGSKTALGQWDQQFPKFPRLPKRPWISTGLPETPVTSTPSATRGMDRSSGALGWSHTRRTASGPRREQ